MSRTADRSDPPGPVYPDVIGLRPTVTGTYLWLRCRRCEHEFESYQPTVAGFAVGEHQCPECSAPYVLFPQDFEAVLARHMANHSLDEMTRLTRQATEIAESWHRPEALASLLTYRGVRLGPATERGLLAAITNGLMSAWKTRRECR